MTADAAGEWTFGSPVEGKQRVVGDWGNLKACFSLLREATTLPRQEKRRWIERARGRRGEAGRTLEERDSDPLGVFLEADETDGTDAADRFL